MEKNKPWPPNYNEVLLQRLHLQRSLKTNSELRKEYQEFYSRDAIAWINHWCFTYNPRNTGALAKTLPFILFPRQEDIVHFLLSCIADKESGLVEKARDMGATWVCAAFSIWMWLYIPGSSVGWGSRKEMLVDRVGDPDSIFEKMRMIIDRLPVWMLPQGLNSKNHLSFMKFINPETDATITGEAGDNIGRGGRKSIYFKDESAHYERPELIEAALGDNTDVQIDISSVHGTGNVFYRRRMAGEIWEPGKKITPGKTRVFIMDWRDHPLKDQAWYDKRRAKAADDGLLHVFAQEVDRDYSASLDRIIIHPSWVKAAIDADKKLGILDDGVKSAALDVADEGGDKNALAIRSGVILKGVSSWGEGDTGKTARRAVKACQENGILELYYDSIGVGAGVKAETNRLREEGLLPAHMAVYPWSAAESPLFPDKNIIASDKNTPKNKDFFANLKAQAWWSLAQRFEKTYKCVIEGANYPHDELISLPSTLPNLHQLCLELSQAQSKETGKGKMMVDKSPDGTPSPNMADGVVMVYWPVKRGIDYVKMSNL